SLDRGTGRGRGNSGSGHLTFDRAQYPWSGLQCTPTLSHFGACCPRIGLALRHHAFNAHLSWGGPSDKQRTVFGQGLILLYSSVVRVFINFNWAPMKSLHGITGTY